MARGTGTLHYSDDQWWAWGLEESPTGGADALPGVTKESPAAPNIMPPRGSPLGTQALGWTGRPARDGDGKGAAPLLTAQVGAARPPAAAAHCDACELVDSGNDDHAAMRWPAVGTSSPFRSFAPTLF